MKILLTEVYPDTDFGFREEKVNYLALFEELCPIYMAYGATYEDFWYGDPRKLRMIRKAHRERQKDENLMRYVQGIYNYNAVATALANAFAKKGAPPVKYLERPLDIFGVSEEEMERRNLAEAKKAQAQFYEWSMALGAKQKREQEKNNG